MTPQARSTHHLTRAGYMVGTLEHYNPFCRRAVDLWNFADLIAAKPGMPVMLVQTTTASNLSARRKKVLLNLCARKWVVECKQEICLHSWALRGKRGERKLWTCEAEWITGDMFKEAT